MNVVRLLDDETAAKNEQTREKSETMEVVMMDSNDTLRQHNARAWLHIDPTPNVMDTHTHTHTHTHTLALAYLATDAAYPRAQCSDRRRL
jgi:hypothetical protein